MTNQYIVSNIRLHSDWNSSRPMCTWQTKMQYSGMWRQSLRVGLASCWWVVRVTSGTDMASPAQADGDQTN